jgi:hypothetical protein
MGFELIIGFIELIKQTNILWLHLTIHCNIKISVLSHSQSQSRSSLCYLVVANDDIAFSASMFKGSCPHWLVSDSIWAELIGFQVQLQVILRPTVSRPACLSVRPSSVAHDQISITVGHLRSSCCGAPSLTRGLVYNLLVQFAVTLGPKSWRTHDHILLSHLRLLQPGGPGPGPWIYKPQEQGGPVIPLGTGFPFWRLLQLAGLWRRYSNPPPHSF